MLISLSNSEFKKNVLTLLTGTSIAQAIPIAISPILTRIYTPEEFGILAIYISIVTILSVVVTGAYDMSIILPQKKENALHLFRLSLFITFFMSGIIAIVIVLFNESLTNLIGNDDISFWLYFIPLSVMFAGLFQTITFWLNRLKYYKNIAQSRIVQSSSTVAIQLGTGFFGAVLNGLVIGRILGQILATLLLIRIFIRNKEKVFYKKKRLKMYALAKRYKKFPIYESGSNLLNASSTEIPVILLTSLFTVSIAGFYALANRILLLPMSLIGSSIGQVFLQSASSKKNDLSALKSITINVYKKLVLIGTVPIALILVFGDLLFSFVFGKAWSIAGEFSQLLSLWLLLVFITSPLSNLLIVLEKQKESLQFNIAIFIARILSIVVGAFLFDDAFYTVLLFGVISTLFWLFWCIYILKQVNISARWAVFEIVKYLLPTVICLGFIRGVFV